MKLKLILLLITLPVFCYSQLSTNEKPISWLSEDEVLQRQIVDIPQVVISKLDLEKLREEDQIDEEKGIPSGFGYPKKIATSSDDSGRLDGLNGVDCILYIENQTLTTNQTFTNPCPIIMKNVTITNGANIIANAQQYILLESNVEVTSNSSLSLSIY